MLIMMRYIQKSRLRVKNIIISECRPSLVAGPYTYYHFLVFTKTFDWVLTSSLGYYNALLKDLFQQNWDISTCIFLIFNHTSSLINSFFTRQTEISVCLSPK